MISETKVLVVDLDGTLCPIKGKGENYQDLSPEPALVSRIRQLADEGWRIVIHSSRGMRTHRGNEGEIYANVLPVVVDWLRRHDIPHHEVRMGKPWPGHDGFYIDDRPCVRASFSRTTSRVSESCAPETVSREQSDARGRCDHHGRFRQPVPEGRIHSAQVSDRSRRAPPLRLVDAGPGGVLDLRLETVVRTAGRRRCGPVHPGSV